MGNPAMAEGLPAKWTTTVGCPYYFVAILTSI
jgi:hypothetical protein